VSEESIRKWFGEVQEYIRENNLEEILDDPSRIFSGDETGFQRCLSKARILAEKGAKMCIQLTRNHSRKI
jgi:hypothetical protein